MSVAPPQFDDTGNLTIGTVAGQIKKVIRSPPIKKDDTSTYHIFLDNQEITLTAAQMFKGPGRFCTLYFDTFKRYLMVNKNDWPKFAEYILQNAFHVLLLSVSFNDLNALQYKNPD